MGQLLHISTASEWTRLKMEGGTACHQPPTRQAKGAPMRDHTNTPLIQLNLNFLLR
jgi:hypothetical protein